MKSDLDVEVEIIIYETFECQRSGCNNQIPVYGSRKQQLTDE